MLVNTLRGGFIQTRISCYTRGIYLDGREDLAVSTPAVAAVDGTAALLTASASIRSASSAAWRSHPPVKSHAPHPTVASLRSDGAICVSGFNHGADILLPKNSATILSRLEHVPTPPNQSTLSG